VRKFDSHESALRVAALDADEAGEYEGLDVHISATLNLGAMARDVRRLRQMPRHRLSAERVESRVIEEIH
jgi:hypothetical protein